MTGWRGRAYRPMLLMLAGAVAGALAGALPAQADPSLSVTGLRQEAGLVEFTLTARNLPAAQRLAPADVDIEAEGVALELRDAVELATLGRESGARRLAVLVIDTSGSMFGEPMTAAVAAASDYAAGLPDDIEIAVVTAGAPSQTVLSPTADRDEVDAALGGLFAFGDTALYDALATAADLAGDSRRYSERRVLVLSDGADTSSAASMSDVRQRLIAADTPVDTVAFRTEEATSDLLADLAEDTGGLAYLTTDTGDLNRAFRRAAGAFTVQFLITAEVPAELAGLDTVLEVSVDVGGEPVTATVPVVLAADPSASTPLARVQVGGASPLLSGGVVVLVFLTLLVVGLLAFSPLYGQAQRRRRLAQVDQFAVAAPAPASAAPAAGSPVTRAALALSERVVRSQDMESRIAANLDRAGVRLRPHEWLLLRALSCLTAVLLLLLFVGPLWAVPLGLLIGWAATELYIRNRTERRKQAFATVLPDALQLIIGSLRSGFSLPQAIDAMVRELPDPVSTEFGRALGEARLGVKLEDALDRVAHRMQNTDLSWAVVAVRVQQEVGGNLAEVLSTTVTTIRERDALRRHVRALSAEGRLSAWILLGLPIAVGAFMFLVRREYVRPLYTEPLGLAMLLIGIVLVVLGGFWLSRVVKVEV